MIRKRPRDQIEFVKFTTKGRGTARGRYAGRKAFDSASIKGRDG